MKYCVKCGNQIDEEAVICPGCGVPQPRMTEIVDNGGLGWSTLGCCIPIAGLILFLVWKDTKPKTAKSAGIGALVSVILLVLYYVVVFSVGVSLYV